MRSTRPKTVGIKDIARELGIAISTVDRALYGRQGINPATRAKVLKMAETLGYRPNLAARNLKLNRHITVAVHVPRQLASFFGPLRQAIEDTAHRYGSALELDLSSYDHLGEGDAEFMRKVLQTKPNGVIITPGNGTEITPLIREVSQSGTAVVCVASDAPRSERLSSVAVDGFISGALAAELLTQTLPKGGPVAVLTGQLSTFNHAEKLRGFAATLATIAPRLTLLPVAEGHENPKEALQQARQLLKRTPTPVAIYINTANSLPVMQALREANLTGKVKVVATDLFPELAPHLESGAVQAALFQRPYTQGRMAMELLMRFLMEGVRPKPELRLAPHIVLRSNLMMFLDSLAETTSSGREEI